MNPARSKEAPSGRERAPRKQINRAAEIVAREAAQFIMREAGSESLITVTRAQSVAHGDRILVFVSVFPIEKAQAAMNLLARKREAFSDHLKAHARMRLPRVEFMLDNGEESGAPSGELPESLVS